MAKKKSPAKAAASKQRVAAQGRGTPSAERAASKAKAATAKRAGKPSKGSKPVASPARGSRASAKSTKAPQKSQATRKAGAARPKTSEPHARFERIYATIAAIPKGQVAAYGEVAEEAGIARGARQVAAALRHLPASRAIPWHRVVLASGHVAPRPGTGYELQIKRLRREGVPVDERGRVERRFRCVWK